MVSQIQNLGLNELNELKQSSPQREVARMPQSPQDKVAFSGAKQDGENSINKKNVIKVAAIGAGAYVLTAALVAKKGGGKFLTAFKEALLHPVKSFKAAFGKATTKSKNLMNETKEEVAKAYENYHPTPPAPKK